MTYFTTISNLTKIFFCTYIRPRYQVYSGERLQDHQFRKLLKHARCKHISEKHKFATYVGRSIIHVVVHLAYIKKRTILAVRDVITASERFRHLGH